MNGFERTRYQEARAVFAQADRVLDTAALTACYDKMAAEISREMAALDPVIVCVMLGGLQPTVEITKRLNFPLEFDYLHATRYRGETAGGELVWKVSPDGVLTDRHVLIIDDILDEGHTLTAILAAIREQRPASLRTAMLLKKNHDRRESEIPIDFLGAEVPDRYVFGAGMDYKGFFRQLPAVYAARSNPKTA
jgi:hypoxanthine phosphoribosyltransferase